MTTKPNFNEYHAFKRVLCAYASLLVFSTLIISLTNLQSVWFLNLLVGLWSVEQIFKLNKDAGRPCTNWRDFYQIYRSIGAMEDRDNRHKNN